MPNFRTTQIPIPQINSPYSVVFDNTANSGIQSAASSYTFTHKVGLGAKNRILIVAVSILSASASVSSISYAGLQLTHFSNTDITNLTTHTEIWYLLNPPTGANTVSVNLSGSIASIAISESYENVDQIKPIGANSANSGIGSPSNSLSTQTNNSRVFANLAIVSTSGISSAGGQSPRTNISGTIGTGAADDRGIITTPMGVTITWNGAGGTDHWASSIIELRPFGSPNYASWVSLPVSQPYFSPIDLNPYLIAPVNVGTYYKAPLNPITSSIYTGSNAPQPIIQNNIRIF